MAEEYKRSLAHIEKVIKTEPIPGADRIELGFVQGWQCVVGKDKDPIKAGDLVVYIEIDSLVPELPMFEFLRKFHFKIRTARFLKQLSQGLILPINDEVKKMIGDVKEGEDVTEKLKIVKYEKVEVEAKVQTKGLNKKMWRITHFFYRWAWFRAIHRFFFGMPVKAAFPSYVPKTDEERIQNGVVKFTEPRKDCYVSEKLEGQSGTFVVIPATGILSKIGFKSKWDYAIYSRQWRVAEDESTSWGRVSKIFEIQKAMEVCADVFFPGGFAIQGEIIGPGIQGNIYQRKTNEFYVFNIWDIERRKYVSFEALLRMCNSLMGIKTVPILNSMFEINHTLGEFLELANGKTALDMETPCLREGIVVRSHDQSLSFKVVSNDYLLQKAKKEIEEDKNEEKQASESVVVV